MDLSEAEAEASLDFLLDGADEALISAFLVLLRAKGETYEEVSNFLFRQYIHMFQKLYFTILPKSCDLSYQNLILEMDKQ